MSTGESWGVNGHTTRCTSPVWSCSFGATGNGDQGRPMGLEARERTLLYTLSRSNIIHRYSFDYMHTGVGDLKSAVFANFRPP